MTATPRLWAGKEMDRLRVAMAGIEAAELIASMDDEALFGPVTHDYPLGTAISDGVIGSASALNRTVTPCSAKDSITRVTSTTAGRAREGAAHTQGGRDVAGHLAEQSEGEAGQASPERSAGWRPWAWAW